MTARDEYALHPTQPSGHLAPFGIPARLVLSILESAGILYASLSPVIVTGLAQSGALDRAQAGYVFSCNMLGTALGGLCIIFFVHRLNWRRASAGLLVVLIVLDLISATVSAPMQLYVLRFAHGLAGGILIGVAMSVIARMVNPERTVALFIMLQLITGGAFTLLLAPLLASPGTYIVWLSLAAFSLLSLLLLPLLGPYPVETRQDGSVATEHTAPFACILFAMIALFIYQCGEMAAFAYVIELGFHYEFNAGFTGTAVAASLWIGGPAALFVTWWSTRSGRLVPFLISGALMVCSIALLLLPIPLSYLLANIGFGIFFSISFPYLMGIASEMDNSGRMGTAAGFAGNLGLAAGPTIAGFLVGENQFERVLMFAIAAIAVSMMLATGPARMLDRRNRTGRVVW